jgi:hypothetical protein
METATTTTTRRPSAMRRSSVRRLLIVVVAAAAAAAFTSSPRASCGDLLKLSFVANGTCCCRSLSRTKTVRDRRVTHHDDILLHTLSCFLMCSLRTCSSDKEPPKLVKPTFAPDIRQDKMCGRAPSSGCAMLIATEETADA